jgi:hypothetical protein
LGHRRGKGCCLEFGGGIMAKGFSKGRDQKGGKKKKKKKRK